MKQLLKRFARDAKGTLAVVMGISAPVVLGVAGIAVDVARYNTSLANLQGLADGAAVVAVQSLLVASSDDKVAASAAMSFVTTSSDSDSSSDSSSANNQVELIANQKNGDHVDVSVKVDAASSSVKVELSQKWTPMLAHLITGMVETPIVVSAAAQMVGQGKACILGLNSSIDRAVYFSGNAKATGNGCGFFSNSTSTSSMAVANDAVVGAQMLCASGGGEVMRQGNVTPDITEDCPALDDPLAGRPAPSVGGCDYNNHEINGAGNFTLQANRVYCGGLRIEGSANVTLESGVYIIKDGPLTLADTASIKGTDVGFFLTGTGTRMNFESGTTVSLEAPVNGEMAGLLFYEDRSNAPVIHRLGSSNARTLLGTIYLPKSNLDISSAASIGMDSAFTALIVDTLRVREGPNVVLNSNYSATNVPVPAGLIGGRVVLTK